MNSFTVSKQSLLHVELELLLGEGDLWLDGLEVSDGVRDLLGEGLGDAVLDGVLEEEAHVDVGGRLALLDEEGLVSDDVSVETLHEVQDLVELVLEQLWLALFRVLDHAHEAGELLEEALAHLQSLVHAWADESVVISLQIGDDSWESLDLEVAVNKFRAASVLIDEASDLDAVELGEILE